MHDHRPVPGSRVPIEAPDWSGLEALLPLSPCGPFMWMGAVDLVTGERLGVYKHSWTRRTLSLDGDGVPHAYRGAAGYGRVRIEAAVEHVFDPWWLLTHASEEARTAVGETFEAVRPRDHADVEAGLSLPPALL